MGRINCPFKFEQPLNAADSILTTPSGIVKSPVNPHCWKQLYLITLRLEGIESVEIKDKKLNEIEEKIKENELVKEVDIHIKGKLIYINITLNTGKHTDSESIAQTSLELFSEEEKAYYDIQYIVSNNDKEIEEKFPVMGYIKAGNSVIKWTNYEIKVEETEGEE